MLELIKTRKTSEAVLNFPEEVHCVDREGNHHRLSEENGMFFMKARSTGSGSIVLQRASRTYGPSLCRPETTACPGVLKLVFHG
ncbi:MAG: hypothetical protein DMG06_30400 [Acidobacteria bacterium]|nr:MAG: hypothetical protein DMG06_30400 [Acidobacteriota bacterium]